jgi:hypothetical protein
VLVVVPGEAHIHEYVFEGRSRASHRERWRAKWGYEMGREGQALGLWQDALLMRIWLSKFPKMVTWGGVRKDDVTEEMYILSVKMPN